MSTGSFSPDTSLTQLPSDYAKTAHDIANVLPCAHALWRKIFEGCHPKVTQGGPFEHFTGQQGSRSFFVSREAMSILVRAHSGRTEIRPQRFSTGSDRLGVLGSTLFVALLHKFVRQPTFPKFSLYIFMFRVTMPSAACATSFFLVQGKRDFLVSSSSPVAFYTSNLGS